MAFDVSTAVPVDAGKFDSESSVPVAAGKFDSESAVPVAAGKFDSESAVLFEPAGSPVLGEDPAGRSPFSVDVTAAGPAGAGPGVVDMGAGQANALRDAAVAKQEEADDWRRNARVFKPGSIPFRVVDGEMIVDPERFGEAAGEMWKTGVIGTAEYTKMVEAAPDIERVVKMRKDLERRAGSSPGLKSALAGAGRGGVALAGGIGAGMAAGEILSGAPKPIAIGGSLLAGAVGSVAAAVGADKLLEEVAQHNELADSVMAAKQLRPGYNMAGELATIAVPVPGAIRNVATAINVLRAEKGAGAAAKFAAGVLGGSAAFGAATDAGVQVANQKIYDALHSETLPLIQAELDRQAEIDGKAAESRPEFSAGSLGVSAAIGALTAGMGVKARNKVYLPEELVGLEKRVLAGRASRADADDYGAMRSVVQLLAERDNLISVKSVQRAVVDVFGSKAVDIVRISDPRFRAGFLNDGVSPAGGSPRPAALMESNPNPRAGVPGDGGDPVYTGQNFIDRGGPGAEFQGGGTELPAGRVPAGALPVSAEEFLAVDPVPVAAAPGVDPVKPGAGGSEIPPANLVQADVTRRVNNEILLNGKWANGSKVSAAERKQLQAENAALTEILGAVSPESMPKWAHAPEQEGQRWINSLMAGNYDSVNKWAEAIPPESIPHVAAVIGREIEGLEMEVESFKHSGLKGLAFKNAKAGVLSRLNSWDKMQRLVALRKPAAPAADVPPAAPDPVPVAAAAGVEPVKPAAQSADVEKLRVHIKNLEHRMKQDKARSITRPENVERLAQLRADLAQAEAAKPAAAAGPATPKEIRAEIKGLREAIGAVQAKVRQARALKSPTAKAHSLRLAELKTNLAHLKTLLPRRKGRTFAQNISVDPGVFPVIADLMESPMRGSKSKAAGGENDDMMTFRELGGWFSVIFRKTGQPIDVRAQELFEAGLIREPSADALNAAVRAEIRQYAAFREHAAKQEAHGKEAIKQDKNFEKDVIDPKSKDGKVAVNAWNLKPGDKVTVGDEVLTVREVNPETLDVVLEDGRKYGIQTVEDGQVIWVESVDRAVETEPDVEDPFALDEEEAAAPAAKKFDPNGEMGMFTGADDPFNLSGEIDHGPELERVAAAKRAAAEAAAQAEKDQTGFEFADMGPGAARVNAAGVMPGGNPAPVRNLANMTDAQIYADFPEAVGIMEARDGGWRMPLILGATDRVPVMEIPEILEFLRELTGKDAQVVKGLKSLGSFNPGTAIVKMRASLYQDEASAAMTLMHEIGHAIHWLDAGTMNRGNILGIIAGLVSHFKHAIPLDPNAAPGEGWGWSGQSIKKKEREAIHAKAWEDLRASLEGEVRRVLVEEPTFAESGITADDVKALFGLEARENMPDIYDWFARQDAATKKAIVVQAMRGIVDPRMDRFKTRVQTGTQTVEREENVGGRMPTNDERREALDNAIRAEMTARNIADLKYVRDELLGLTRWWKPYPAGSKPEYIQYRENGAELYADAMSVLLNSPEDLKRRCPVFWQAWWNYLDKRPKVKAKLLELYERMNNGRDAVLAKRDEIQRAGMVKGSEIFMDAVRQSRARRESLLGWWENFKDQYWDRYSPIMDAVNANVKAGKIDRAKADHYRWMTEEHPMADGRLQLRLADIGRIYEKLDALRIPHIDLGLYLMHDRVINERIEIKREIDGVMEVIGEKGRAVMANPGGMSPRTSQEQLDYYKRTWSREKWATIQAAAAEFRDVAWGMVEAGIDAGLYPPEVVEMMRDNRHAYATFTVLDYVTDYLPAGIKNQIGTHKLIADPAQQTMLKGIAIFRAAQENRFKRKAVASIMQLDPGAAYIAPMKFDGRRQVPQEPKERGWKLITWKDNGKTVGAHVKERYARMWDGHSPSTQDAIVRVLATGFSRTVYATIIRYNPAFQLALSPLRDLQRSVTNMPGGLKGRAQFVRRLLDPEVWGAALDWARGDVGKTALMREMIEASAVGGPHAAFRGQVGEAEDSIDALLKKWHLLNDHKGRGKILDTIMAGLRWIEYAGQVLQIVPKAAAYKAMMMAGIRQKQAAAHIRTHIGIPNYYKKGAHVSSAGALVPFLNIFLRGYESMFRMAAGRERIQGAGEWWLFWMLTGGGLVTILQTLAREGVLGEDWKRKYERVPEWDLTNFAVLAIGETATGERGGKTVYVRLPMDEGLRVINATVHKALTYGIRTARGEAAAPGIGDIASGVTATVPGVNPLLRIGETWGTFLQGQMPYDKFRGRDILSRDEATAGGWPAVSRMLGWTLGEAGITNFFMYDREANSTKEIIIGSTPILNRLIKITDKGLAQTEAQQIAADDKLMAKVRIGMPKDIISLRTEYYWLVKRRDRLDARQQSRYADVLMFMRSYNRAMQEVETDLEIGHTTSAERTIKMLGAEARSYRPR